MINKKEAMPNGTASFLSFSFSLIQFPPVRITAVFNARLPSSNRLAANVFCVVRRHPSRLKLNTSPIVNVRGSSFSLMRLLSF